jgi:hypothetical protein
MFKRLREKWSSRPKRKQRISYGRKLKYNWDVIESLNYDFGITRETCFVDYNGYLRWKADKRLCHRDIAYNHVYRKGSFDKKFSDYDVHHKNENKFDNNPKNLEVIKRKEHKLEHGQTIYEGGQKYIRLVPAHRRRKETYKAVLIGGRYGTWYPKSQLINRNGYIYASEWIYKQKHGDY